MSAYDLFNKRKEIADLCEKWCKQHHLPVNADNIILATLRMKLMKITKDINEPTCDKKRT